MIFTCKMLQSVFFAFLTEQISILRSWGDDVVAVTRLQTSAEAKQSPEVIVNIIVYFGCFSRSVFEYAQ